MGVCGDVGHDHCSGGASREAVLDLGMGDALVGRCVKKAVGNRGFTEGRVSFYNPALRSYQVHIFTLQSPDILHQFRLIFCDGTREYKFPSIRIKNKHSKLHTLM